MRILILYIAGLRKYPLAGFSRSIYHTLTGQKVPVTLTHISVSIPDEANPAIYAIYNTTGQLMQVSSLVPDQKTDISSWMPGIYILMVQNSEMKVGVAKWIKI